MIMGKQEKTCKLAACRFFLADASIYRRTMLWIRRIYEKIWIRK